MFALATQDVDSTAKSIADTIKAAGSVIGTDLEKAITIVSAVEAMPNLPTVQDRQTVIRRLTAFGISQAVVDLALSKLGTPIGQTPTRWPWWFWAGIVLAALAVVGGGYWIWKRRKKTSAAGRI